MRGKGRGGEGIRVGAVGEGHEGEEWPLGGGVILIVDAEPVFYLGTPIVALWSVNRERYQSSPVSRLCVVVGDVRGRKKGYISPKRGEE